VLEIVCILGEGGHVYDEFHGNPVFVNYVGCQ